MMNENEIILEEYKLYVEMADRVSARRIETNKFYITLLTALLGFLTLVVDKKIFVEHNSFVFFLMSFLGVALNIVWIINIASFRQLNSGKFEVIHSIESKLPIKCFKDEWDILGKGEKAKKYLQLTRIEKFVPIILGMPYFALFIYSVYNFLK